MGGVAYYSIIKSWILQEHASINMWPFSYRQPKNVIASGTEQYLLSCVAGKIRDCFPAERGTSRVAIRTQGDVRSTEGGIDVNS
jgi:hypothetical protein